MEIGSNFDCAKNIMLKLHFTTNFVTEGVEKFSLMGGRKTFI